MPAELHYTSLPRGLAPGSQGFATVARTPDIAPPLQAKLESLSGYRELSVANGVGGVGQPVNWSFTRLSVGGIAYAVLSRVAFAGADYTGRTNKYAHHLVLSADECARLPAGPAWLLAQPAVMDAAWHGDARMLPHGRTLPSSSPEDGAPRPCAAWRRVVGDAGWGGQLARRWVEHPGQPTRLIYACAQIPDVLPLIAEAVALLPPARRWEATFTTYASDLPRDMACVVRGLLVDAPGGALPSAPGETTFDLTRTLGPPPDDAWTVAARTGAFPAKPAAVRPGAPAAVVVPMAATAAIPAADVPVASRIPPPSFIPSVPSPGFGTVPPLPGTARGSVVRPVPAAPPWGWIALTVGLALLAFVGWGLFLCERVARHASDPSEATDMTDPKGDTSGAAGPATTKTPGEAAGVTGSIARDPRPSLPDEPGSPNATPKAGPDVNGNESPVGDSAASAIHR